MADYDMMDEEAKAKEKKKRLDPDGLLDQLCSYWSESKKERETYEYRWAKNILLIKGQFSANEMSRSKVRQRSKLFFRKIWSNNIRLLAAFHGAFLKDQENQFRIIGRGPEDEDPLAKRLQFMTEYRRDQMMRRDGLYMKFINSFLDILELGWAPALMHWKYKKDEGIDGPCFDSFPPEQVYPDFSAQVKQEMQYCFFEEYITKDEMEMRGYLNLDEVKPCGPEYNQVRAARYLDSRDPLQSNPGENEYPAPGAVSDGKIGGIQSSSKYKVMHCFYKSKNKLHYCVTSGNFSVKHKESDKSPYGDRFPLILGLCLPMAHRLIGEGFPEPLEGPQESYNDTINRRKDNVAIFMNRGTIVSRYGGVDLESLLNSRPGGVTMADDVNAVRERQMGDITQSAYVEARDEDAMMGELAGVTDVKLGMAKTDKTGVAQINQFESSAKIDLFISIVAETFIKEFFSMLAYMIQRFETNETIMKVANERTINAFKDKDMSQMAPYLNRDLDDFDADVIVNVGTGTVSRDIEVRNGFIAMDRAIQANQSLATLIQFGAVPPEGIQVADIMGLFSEILPKIGYKNTQKYIIKVQPPAPAQADGGAGVSPTANKNILSLIGGQGAEPNAA
jgi:hypothetical protein